MGIKTRFRTPESTRRSVLRDLSSPEGAQHLSEWIQSGDDDKILALGGMGLRLSDLSFTYIATIEEAGVIQTSGNKRLLAARIVSENPRGSIVTAKYAMMEKDRFAEIREAVDPNTVLFFVNPVLPTRSTTEQLMGEVSLRPIVPTGFINAKLIVV